MGWTEADYVRVKRLVARGLSDYKVAAISGVPRSTVPRWRLRDVPPRHALLAEGGREFEIHDPAAYCYLLGCYLGDGHVEHRPPNGWTLRIACDRKYGAIIAEIVASMSATFPDRMPTRFSSSTGASEVVSLSHPAVRQAIPQHAPGRKHLRPIVLTDWQLGLTHREPGSLIRGLIHSDGCRVMNRFRTKLPSGRIAEYSYVRYFFSNLSADIRRIFIEHCELLGVDVTQSNHRNLTVSHRKSVAILEELVGPKT